jgi:hypothetical protein
LISIIILSADEKLSAYVQFEIAKREGGDRMRKGK